MLSFAKFQIYAGPCDAVVTFAEWAGWEFEASEATVC